VKKDGLSLIDLNQKQFSLIMLDLNMPISNGYETCKNIWNLYEDRNIFNMKRRRSSQLSGGHDDLLLIHLRPLIVAWTSENLSDKKLVEKINQVGFDLMMESPITFKHITDKILPKLQERKY